jgi:hypothetical protein
MERVSFYLSSLLLAGMVVGCGSSGPVEVAPKATLSGVAVDDVIVTGDVKAYPAGSPTNVLKTGHTDAEGKYLLEVEHKGIVVVEVTCGTNGKMKNLKTGTIRECEDDLALRSAAHVTEKHKEIEVNLSPLTEVVVTQFEENGGTTDALEAAQESMVALFQFNPLTTNPVENSQYSGTISAFRALADDKNVTLKKVIAELNEDLADGELGDDGNISQELAMVMKKEEVNNKFTDSNGTLVLPNPKELSDIAASKAFFNELRTQAMSVVDYDESGTPGFLDEEAKKLGDALENIALDVNIIGEYSSGIIDEIYSAIDENKIAVAQHTIDDSQTRTFEATKSAENVWDYTIAEGDASYKGTVTLPSEAPDEIDLSGDFGTLVAKIDGVLPLKRPGEANQGIQSVKLDTELKKVSDGATFKIKELTLSHDKTALKLSDVETLISYNYNKEAQEDDKLTLKFAEFKSAKVEGSVEGYTLDTILSIPTYVTNSSISAKGFEYRNPSEVYLNGNVMCFDNSTMPMPVQSGTISYNDNGIKHNASIVNGRFSTHFTSNGENFQMDTNQVHITAQECQDSKVTDFYYHVDDENEDLYNSGRLPKKMTLEGSIINTATKGAINGKLSLDWLNASTMDLGENSEEEPSVDVKIVGKIKMPERPEMILNIGYKNPENKNNFTFSYAYDTTTIDGTGAFDKEMKNGTIILNSGNGVKSTILVENGETIYGPRSSVTRYGRHIGQLEEREGLPVIKYTDGTFESLP